RFPTPRGTWGWAGCRRQGLPFRSCLLSTCSKALGIQETARCNWRQAKAACIVPENRGLRQGAWIVELDGWSWWLLGQQRRGLIDEELGRAVLGLVVHLAAVLDPVAEIDCVQPLALGLGYLPENGEATQAAAFLVRIVEGVNRR